jgi:hypothetical protein
VYCWEEGIWGFCIFGMNGDNGGSVGVVDVMEERESENRPEKFQRERKRESLMEDEDTCLLHEW